MYDNGDVDFDNASDEKSNMIESQKFECIEK